MAASLSAVLGVLTSAGERVDRALAVAGSYFPAWLKLGAGLTGSASRNGPVAEVSIAVDTTTIATRAYVDEQVAGGGGGAATTGTELDGAHTVPGSVETFDVADSRWIAVGATLLFGDAGDPFFIGSVDAVPTRAAPGQVTVALVTLVQPEGTTMPDGTPVTLSGVRGAAGADGNDGNDGDPGAAGPAGRVYSAVRTVSGATTAVAGEHLTLTGGTYTVALPAASASPAGTAIGWTVVSPTVASTMTFARSSTDNIGATGSATTLPVGDAPRFLSGRLVSDGVSRWKLDGHNPAEYASIGVTTEITGYVTSGEGMNVSAFSFGIQLTAYGDTVRLYGEDGVLCESPLYSVESTEPATPLSGCVEWCVGTAKYIKFSDGVVRTVLTSP